MISMPKIWPRKIVEGVSSCNCGGGCGGGGGGCGGCGGCGGGCGGGGGGKIIFVSPW